MKKIVLVFTLLAFVIMGVNAQTPWYLTGNSGTNPSSNFIGTTDNNPLIFKTRGIERMKLLSDKPFLGIGVSTPQATLHLHQLPGMDPSQKLLQLTTDATGNGNGNGFSIFSDAFTKDIRFQQMETAKFFVEGPGGGFVIAPTGNIGIGTEEPAEMLHITGNILSEGDLTVKDKIILTPDYEDAEYWEIERDKNGLNFMQTEQITKPEDSAAMKGGIGGTWKPRSRLFISNDGKIGIGTTTPQVTLEVKGSVKISSSLTAYSLSAQSADITNTLTANLLSAKSANIDGTLTANLLSAPSAKITGLVCAQEVKVQLSGSPCWPDYVFGKNYNLMPLPELQSFITENQHLPNIPSAAEVEENGVELGEMNAKLLQKVEELTLYILDLQKQIDELKTK